MTMPLSELPKHILKKKEALNQEGRNACAKWEPLDESKPLDWKDSWYSFLEHKLNNPSKYYNEDGSPKKD